MNSISNREKAKNIDSIYNMLLYVREQCAQNGMQYTEEWLEFAIKTAKIERSAMKRRLSVDPVDVEYKVG